jgi:glycosyltransferase involved in cell wall biosynthesis
MLVTDQYPPMVGGVPTVTYELATALARRRHNITVIAPNYGPHDTYGREGSIFVYRFSSFEWPTYKGQRIPFLPILPLRYLIKQIDPDVIHIHSAIVLGNLAQILADGLRKSVVVTNHYLPINMARTLDDQSFLGRQVSNLTYGYLVSFCNRCGYVTAPTRTALNLLTEHGLRVPARALSNGINLRKYFPGPRNEAVLRRFNLPTDRPLAIHVNRLSEEKRVNIIIDAMTKLQSNIHLVLVGSGPAMADLQEQSRRLGLEQHISFLGFMHDEDLLPLRQAADFFVIASVADLQSLATMEAMACGLPVIAANAYALPELVHHDVNGFLFQPGDSDELARYIDLLAANSELRARMGAASLKIIAGHESSKVIDEWELLYQHLAAAPRRKRGLARSRVSV